MAFDNSFVVMNEEEMHDVNGGFFWGKGVSRFWTGIAIDGAIIAAGLALSANSFFKH